MAKLLENRVRSIAGVRITRPVQCNAIFATLDRKAIETIQKEFFFYVFDENVPEVRWMAHHATREADVDAFAAVIAKSLGE
jgi:threonine aldolase